MSIVDYVNIKKYRQNIYRSNGSKNYFIFKLYFNVDDLNQIPCQRTNFEMNHECWSLLVNHLNKSLNISSPFGRLFSYRKAYLDIFN